MDFALNEEQQAVVALAGRILADRCEPTELRQIERDGWFHERLWEALAGADLLGLCVAEADGGAGLGFLEICLLLECMGRHVAPVPLRDGLVAAQAISRWGSETLRQAWLAPFIAGEAVFGLALAEGPGDAREATLSAEPTPSGWRLSGTKTAVAYAERASLLLVTARTPDGEQLLVAVPTGGPGVTMAAQDSFSHEPQAQVVLEGVDVPTDHRLGDTAGDGTGDGAGDGASDPCGWLLDRATVAVAAVAAGVAEGGLRQTAAYTIERHQFSKPIATFQAVSHRMADCFIDHQAMQLTMLAAAVRLDAAEPAADEVAIAKFWAAEGASRVGHAALHLHGGISIDLDYPIHRYFLWAKHLEHTLGSTSAELARLGAQLAATST